MPVCSADAWPWAARRRLDALTLALAGGLAARSLRLSPVVGYLFAGMVVGPFTPGYRANTETLHQLAQVGVVFLMFGVGLHSNLHDLTAVRRIDGRVYCRWRPDQTATMRIAPAWARNFTVGAFASGLRR
ncbi:MAG: hypothetical protein C4558_06780 [Dehalococcoidia bacterium]|nr:MAG: hypothetical protein C4558_06780 [Dehalococcoidia bacterium]